MSELLLEKLAKEKKKKESFKKQIGKGLAGLVGGTGAALGVNTAGVLGATKLSEKNAVSPDQVKKQVEKFKKSHNLKTPVYTEDDSPISLGNAGFVGKNAVKNLEQLKNKVGNTGTVITPTGNINFKGRDFTDDEKKHGFVHLGLTGNRTDESVPLHELGHAANAEKTRGANTFVGTIGVAGIPIAPISGAILGHLAARSEAKGKELKGVRKVIDKHPYLTHAALNAPLLAEEGLASGRAANHLRKEYGLKEGLKKSAPLGAAYGSYVGLAGLSSALGGGSYKLSKALTKRYLDRKKKAEDEDEREQD